MVGAVALNFACMHRPCTLLSPCTTVQGPHERSPTPPRQGLHTPPLHRQNLYGSAQTRAINPFMRGSVCASMHRTPGSSWNLRQYCPGNPSAQRSRKPATFLRQPLERWMCRCHGIRRGLVSVPPCICVLHLRVLEWSYIHCSAKSIQSKSSPSHSWTSSLYNGFLE